MQHHIHTENPLHHALQEKIDNLNKPKGSMGKLEELALQIGLIQQSLEPELTHPCHLLFGADHGIEQEGVSISPREVTWQQMVNFSKGGGGVNMFCRQHGFELILVDVGVDHNLSHIPLIRNCKIAPHGTQNFLHKPAMSERQMQQCLKVGADLVDECANKGCNILSIGEMGIANTSPSSIWMHLLQGHPLEQCVGAGAGLNHHGIAHKLQVLQQATERFTESHPSYTPHHVMSHFGGFEMVAATGAMLRAYDHHMTVLIDGFIMTACALMASHINPQFLQNAIFCHQGDEAGHRLMLETLDVKGLLQLGLRLGEGTGALCAYPIVESAVRMLNEMNNFQNAQITKYF